MSKTSKINQVRILLRTKLAHLSEQAYPNITARLKTQEGYKQMEEQIIRYAAKNNLSLDNAIAHLEMEM